MRLTFSLYIMAVTLDLPYIGQQQSAELGFCRQKMKYILVTGGVVSGLGKGVTASSIGVLLKACGLRVTSIKIGIILELKRAFRYLIC